LSAHFGERDAGADIRNRSNLDRLDEALEHLVEKVDLLAVETAGGQQEEVRHALGGVQALCRRADLYCRFDFIDNR